MIQKEIPDIKWCPLAVILLLSCNTISEKPDVSQIDINLPLYHLEDKLFSLDTNNLQAELDILFRQYPVFCDVYFNQILTSSSDAMNPVANTAAFISDPDMRTLFESSVEKFSDFSEIEEDLVSSLQYYKYYFPDAIIPEIYTCVTGLSVGAFSIGEEILGVSLEFYLGEDYPMYNPRLFPEYVRRTMNKEHLVSKTLQALIEAKVKETAGIRMLDFMIRNGKVLYLKNMIMPFISDTVIFEFSPPQIEWLEDHENQIWAHLLESGLLYETDYRKFQKLISPSPNIPNMPPEAPGRTANWIGLQIINAFMRRNPGISFNQLLHESDAQRILTRSRYKPRR